MLKFYLIKLLWILKRAGFCSVLSWIFASAAPAQLATPNEDGMAYGHVHLNVPDLEEHLAIWESHFAGEVISIGSGLAVKFPNFLIMFEEREPASNSIHTVMHHFGFKLRDLDSFIARWEAAGFKMGPVFTGSEGYPNAYITLPGGVEVELQEDQGLYREFTGYHIHFSSDGFLELLDWYNTIFNLETQPRGALSSTTNVPGMNMSFGQLGEEPFVLGEGPFIATRGNAIDHIGFEIENLEAFCRQLEAKGLEFDQPYYWNADLGIATASFTDPEGVLVELTEGLRNY